MSKYPSGKRKKGITQENRIRREIDQDPNTFVLRLLLNAAPYYVSGSIIAQQLKMSRVAVWSRTDSFGKAGLTIEASQNLDIDLRQNSITLMLHLSELGLIRLETIATFLCMTIQYATNAEAEDTNGANAPFAAS